MNDLIDALRAAFDLMLNFDASLAEIVLLSLHVSLSAVALAALFGFPFGAALALARFPGQRLLVVILNALMGLPSVVVGLIVYLLLSRSGPLGSHGLLFTPTAMIIAQWILVTPLIAALTRQIVADLWLEYHEQLTSLGSSQLRMLPTLLWEGRFSLITALLAGFGKAFSEIGAVLIVGGNIAHHTRVMTTSIALETAKGDLALALGLGIILIILALLVNGAAYLTQDVAKRIAG
jgi:tungstate transport system permease protein